MHFTIKRYILAVSCRRTYRLVGRGCSFCAASAEKKIGMLGSSGSSGEELNGEFEQRFIKPITNASYPGTLAALSLTVYRVALIGGSVPYSLKTVLLLAAATFLVASLSIFFYSLYPTRVRLWTITALCYLSGLFALMASVAILLLVPDR